MAKKLQATIQAKAYDVPVKPESTLKPAPAAPMGSAKPKGGFKGGHHAGRAIRGEGY